MPAKNLSASGVLFDERRTFNLDDSDLIELYPNVTPFTIYMLDRGSDTVDDPDFKMFQYRNRWRYTTLSINDGSPGAWSPNGQPGGTVSDVEIDNLKGVSDDSSLEGKQVEIWNSAEDTYKGNAIIDTVDSNGIDLRSLGKADAANEAVSALADDDKLFILNHMAGEGETAPEADSGELEVVWNSCFINRIPVEITGTLKATALRNGGRSSEVARLREEARKRHAIEQERGYIFGYRPGGIGGTAHGAGDNDDSNQFVSKQISNSDGNVVRSSMGYLPIARRYFVSDDTADDQNFFNRSKGSYGYEELVEDADKIFQYTPDGVRTAFCGPGAMTFWSKFVHANSQYQVSLSGTEKDRFGNRIRFLDTGHGILRLVPLNILRRTPYASWMLIPDMDTIERKVFRSSTYESDIKTDDNYDGQKDEYFSDNGMGLRLPERNHVIALS